MDFQEATRIIYTKLLEIEPKYASKILGWILMQEYSEDQIAELSQLSTEDFYSTIDKAKITLNISSKLSNNIENDGKDVSRISSEADKRIEFQAEHEDEGLTLRGAEPLGYLRKKLISSPVNQVEPTGSDLTNGTIRHQSSTLNQVNSRAQSQEADSSNVFSERHPWHRLLNSNSTISSVKAEFDTVASMDKGCSEESANDACSESSLDSLSNQKSKTCMYFVQGHCKHGPNCRFSHSPSISTHSRNSSIGSDASSNYTSQSVSECQSSDSPAHKSSHVCNSDENVQSLEKLEHELQELLGGKQLPVSIASLPQLYFERYGKNLQADGYLTESQRQGKTGYSLTKLLSKMKTSIVLVDRPNGQRAVTLKESLLKHVSGLTVEDLQLYSAALPEYNEINPNSRQIYLTFPAESTFSEEDVAAHFRAYGVVQDVRIPNQQKRMFGFVTFASHITVQSILSIGNPHYICGARVLVKPYKEKGKHSDKLKKGDKGSVSLRSVNMNYSLPSPIPSQYSTEVEEMILGMDGGDLNLMNGNEFQLVDAQRRRLESEARVLAIQQQKLMQKAKEQWYKQKIQSQMQMQMNQNQILNPMMSNMDMQYGMNHGLPAHLPHQQTGIPLHSSQLQIPSMMYSTHLLPRQQQNQQQLHASYPYPKLDPSSLPSPSQIQINDDHSFMTSQLMYPFIHPSNHLEMMKSGLMTQQQSMSHQSGMLGSPQKMANRQVYPPNVHVSNATSYPFTEFAHKQNTSNHVNDTYQEESVEGHPSNPYEFVVSNLVDENEENVSYKVNTGAKNLKLDLAHNLPDSLFSSSSMNPSDFSNEYFNIIDDNNINFHNHNYNDRNITNILNNNFNHTNNKDTKAEELLSHSFKNMSFSSPSDSSSLNARASPFSLKTSCSICFEQNTNNISPGCHHFYCANCFPQVKNGCFICHNPNKSFEVNAGQMSTPSWGESKSSDMSKPTW